MVLNIVHNVPISVEVTDNEARIQVCVSDPERHTTAKLTKCVGRSRF